MATITGELFLSKVINEDNISAINKHRITRDHFVTAAEKATYEFLIDYSQRYDGSAPSFQVVVENIPSFEWQADVTDSFGYLSTQLVKAKTNREIAALINNEGSNTLDGFWQKAVESGEPVVFLQDMQKALAEIEHANRNSSKIGNSLGTASGWYLDEFQERKEGRSSKVWQSHFPKLDGIIGGGYTGGNIYGWFAKSGRGKSIVTMVEILEAALQGANVLVWTLEMSKYEWASRAIAFLSCVQEVRQSRSEGLDHLEGFEVSQMVTAKFDDIADESQFLEYVKDLNNSIKGSVTIRAVDDSDFMKRDVWELERNIEELDIDVVLVDPIYYMDNEKNESKTAGGDVAATSKALRRITGRTKVVMHVITQAEEDHSEQVGEDRELSLPKRSEIKKSKAILEDSAIILGFDSCDGRFEIMVNKGRSGGEGEGVEGVFLPGVGYMEESDEQAIAELPGMDIVF